MTPGEIKRLYFIIRVFLSYGLDELIPKIKLTLPLRIGRLGFFWIRNQHKDSTIRRKASPCITRASTRMDQVWANVINPS